MRDFSACFVALGKGCSSGAQCAARFLIPSCSLPTAPLPLCNYAVVASEKGVVVGRLTFREDGDQIDCRRMGVGGKAIPPNIDKASLMNCPWLRNVPELHG